MQFEYLKDICYNHNSSIRKVLDSFGSTGIHTEGRGFGIILNDNNICIGVVSDGDIRRKLVEGVNIDSSIKEALNNDFTFSRNSYFDFIG